METTIEIRGGSPTDEEIAAVVAVLLHRAVPVPAAGSGRPGALSRWAGSGRPGTLSRWAASGRPDAPPDWRGGLA